MSNTPPPPDMRQVYLPKTHQRALGLLTTLLLLLTLITYYPLEQGRGLATPARDELPPVPALTQQSVEEQSAPPPPTVAVRMTVNRGNTLSSLFKQAGYGPALVDQLYQTGADSSVLSDISPGDVIELIHLEDNTLVSISITKSPLESHKFIKSDNGTFSYEPLTRTPEVRQVRKEAVITDSLFMAAQRSDIPAALALELATTIFGGVIDFILDTREGDRFRILYEEKYLDGIQIDYGRILAAEFINSGKAHVAVRFIDEQGKHNYFTPEGESMRKAFILNPVDWTRISDGFSLSRKHPILNTIRAHKGTDYAAPTGTPVKATADGRVTFADRNGSFGKLVVIQHGNRFVTKYAHLNGYAKGIKAGVRVKQNDIIGYVGSTGAATGPHLHYELLVDGVHQDSRKVFANLPQAESIDSNTMPKFKSQTSQLLLALQNDTSEPAGGGQKALAQ